jgi:ATP-binding cassette subfamily B (MDR/TAP) protein 1
MLKLKSAFLNGHLNEEVYMEQPQGFQGPGKKHRVCQLVKSSYRLKQAWYFKIDQYLRDSEKVILNPLSISKTMVMT